MGVTAPKSRAGAGPGRGFTVALAVLERTHGDGFVERFPVAASVVRSGIAAVVSAVLVVTLLSPTERAEAAEWAFGADPAETLPAPPSTPAPPVVPTIPKGGDFSIDSDDLSTAVSTPVATGKGRTSDPLDLSELDLDDLEVLDRSEFETTYELPSGREIAVLSEQSQNVLVDGEWVAIDGVLEREAALREQAKSAALWFEYDDPVPCVASPDASTRNAR